MGYPFIEICNDLNCTFWGKFMCNVVSGRSDDKFRGMRPGNFPGDRPVIKSNIIVIITRDHKV